MQNSSFQPRGDERRRLDWHSNDRRKHLPWVMDSNDRRSGDDRRLTERRATGSRVTQAASKDWKIW